jgi:hypothetical protein
MIRYDQEFERLLHLLTEKCGFEPRDDRSKYWHRFNDLRNEVVVAVETVEHTHANDEMNVYVASDGDRHAAPPSWAEFRESGRGHVQRAPKRIMEGPHHFLKVDDPAKAEELLAYLGRLLSSQNPGDDAREERGGSAT